MGCSITFTTSLNRNRFFIAFATLVLLCWAGAVAQDNQTSPIVIAHRGASGYIPEHTEGAKVLAVAQGADFIEQDVVLSRDKVLVVCHDITLHETTDVEAKFPDRKRADGGFYMADFDWQEIAQLSVVERKGRGGEQAFANRFPGGFHQRLMRLEDELALLAGLSRTLNRKIGCYIELKRPGWHRENMKVDVSEMLLGLLHRMNIDPSDSLCFIQCFEHDELRHLKQDLDCKFPLVALTGGMRNRDASQSDQIETQLREIAAYAKGVGPSIEALMVVENGKLKSTGFVEAAHRAGLVVHPYTVRRDALPRWAESFEQLHQILVTELRVDGFFTDFPLDSRRAVDSLTRRGN